jgi:transketolase
MRSAFIAALTKACEDSPEVLLVTGDLGFKVLDDFRTRFPDRFLNVGVAEQNLSGVGAGLALTGHVVFTYSIANFPILRCLEQIRNDICYHDADVKIVSVGGGLSYGTLGPSHFATEDLGIMRMLPGMTVVAPGDPVEVERLVPQIIARPGPVYLRLGRDGEARVTPWDAQVRLGEPNVFFDQGDVLLLTTGGLLEAGLATRRQLLEDHGLPVGLASVHTLKPLDTDWIVSRARECRLVVTLEEHSVLGGLGGAVAETLAESPARARLLRIGLPAAFPDAIGSQDYLRGVFRLDPPSLTRKILDAVARSA